jgi:hypothetical protein
MMFEPLLYHMTASDKGWNRWSDNTSVLLLSIIKDQKLRRDERVGAQRQVCPTQTLLTLVLLPQQILERLYNSRFTDLASLQTFLNQTHRHPRVSRSGDLKHYFELSDTESEGSNADALVRFQWMDNRLPSAVTHRDELESTMKKAASNARNSRHAAGLNQNALGWAIVSSSCYPWLGIDAKTRKRKYEVLAMAAIFEHVLMNKYQPKLLNSTSIAHLRLSMAEVMRSHSKDGMWEFVDGLTSDKGFVPEGQDTSSQVVEKPALSDKKSASIKKIIDAVQNSPAATSDGPNTVLDGHVSDALYYMVIVSLPLFPRRQHLKWFIIGIVHEHRKADPQGDLR